MKQLFQAGPWNSLASPWGTTESLIGSINTRRRCYQKPGCFVKNQGGLGTIILITYLSPPSLSPKASQEDLGWEKQNPENLVNSVQGEHLGVL